MISVLVVCAKPVSLEMTPNFLLPAKETTPPTNNNHG